jgi:transposase
MERVEQRHGPCGRITPAVAASLRQLVRQQPDATLVELQQRLRASERIPISFQHLWRVLQSLGLRLKKSHSTPKNKMRPRSKPVARRGGRR